MSNAPQRPMTLRMFLEREERLELRHEFDGVEGLEFAPELLEPPRPND